MVANAISKILYWFVSTSFWRWLARHIIAHVTFRIIGYPKFPIEDYFKIRDLLQNQDENKIFFFCSKDRMSLPAILITRFTGPDTKTHAGIVLPCEGDCLNILHMKGNGVNLEHILNLLKEIDELTIHAISLSAEAFHIAQARIKYVLANREKITYDYEQKLENGDSFYCSEEVYFILDKLIYLEPKKILGRLVFSPNDLSHIGEEIYSWKP